MTQKRRQRHSGQGLVEYLILVCLLAVSAIAVVSVVGQNLKARYANISSALRGKKPAEELQEAGAGTYQLRGFDDFNEGAAKPDGGLR